MGFPQHIHTKPKKVTIGNSEIDFYKTVCTKAAKYKLMVTDDRKCENYVCCNM